MPKGFQKGKPPPKHKEKCTCFRCTGEVWNKGIEPSEETKKKLSEALKGRPSRRAGTGKPTKDPYVVDEETGCWNARYLNKAGYGRMWDGKSHVSLHRYTYEKYKGKIPDGYKIYHLCLSRKCCNPEHLEAVTQIELRRRTASSYLNYTRKGIKLSEETKEKLRQAHLGKHLSEEHKRKIGKAGKGKKRTEETKKKMSLAKKGIIPSNKGKHLTEEWKKKISESNKGKKSPATSKRNRTNIGEKNPRYGKHHTQEARDKISAYQKKNPKSKEFYKMLGILGSKALQDRKEPTSIEKIIYDYLLFKRIIFEKQRLINGRFIVDAYIPSLNLIIEADGDYWHSLDKVKKRDKAKNAYLTKCGFNLIRLSEKEIHSGKFKERLVI